MKRRVMITGMGVISPAGGGKTRYWESLERGVSLVAALSRFDASGYRTQIAAEISQLPSSELVRNVNPRLCDPVVLIALAAAREALEEAGLESPTKASLYVGSAIGAIVGLDREFSNFYVHGPNWVTPFTVPQTMLNATASLLAIELGIRGQNLTFGTACSSSSHAIGMGYLSVASGGTDICIAGGSEYPLSPGHVKAWDRLRAMSPDNDTPQRACRPFSANRSGLVLGEGAAFIVLEALESMAARGVKALAEVVGYGANCDADDMLLPSLESQVECMEMALARAGLEGAPTCISAHATGTIDGDKVEAQAIREVFGASAREIPVTAIKSLVGHSLGSSGALAVVAAVLGLSKGLIPPVANYEAEAPDISLDLVADRARTMDCGPVLINSFAFGGSNATLLLDGVKS